MKNNSNDSQKSEDDIPKKGPFEQNWNEFIGSMKKGFQDFQKTLEEESKKNREEFEKSKEKVDEFFQEVRENWDKKLKHWKSEIERKNLETKEQWEKRRQKMQDDFDQWKKNTRKDFKDGVKGWNRFWIKSSYACLLFMIPILIILIVLGWILTQVFEISF